MSIFNKIGGGFPPNMPTAQNVRNHQNQNTDIMNGIIRSAVWPQRAGLGQSVPFSIKLNRLPIAKSAISKASGTRSLRGPAISPKGFLHSELESTISQKHQMP